MAKFDIDQEKADQYAAEAYREILDAFDGDLSNIPPETEDGGGILIGGKQRHEDENNKQDKAS